jgi:hypothetical protein
MTSALKIIDSAEPGQATGTLRYELLLALPGKKSGG